MAQRITSPAPSSQSGPVHFNALSLSLFPGDETSKHPLVRLLAPSSNQNNTKQHEKKGRLNSYGLGPCTIYESKRIRIRGRHARRHLAFLGHLIPLFFFPTTTVIGTATGEYGFSLRRFSFVSLSRVVENDWTALALAWLRVVCTVQHTMGLDWMGWGFWVHGIGECLVGYHTVEFLWAGNTGLVWDMAGFGGGSRCVLWWAWNNPRITLGCAAQIGNMRTETSLLSTAATCWSMLHYRREDACTAQKTKQNKTPHKQSSLSCFSDYAPSSNCAFVVVPLL